MENNERVLKRLERTAREIQQAQDRYSTSKMNSIHDEYAGGGKLTRGQLADYRMKHIQKLLNKQKKNKSVRKFNRRLNKTIKLY